jgi:hypothetical protein
LSSLLFEISAVSTSHLQPPPRLLLAPCQTERTPPLHLVIKPFIETSQHRHRAMAEKGVPAPGPAKLKRNAGPDEWLEASKNCKYLSEYHMKQLCDIVKEYMMEGLLLCAFSLRHQLLISFRIKYSARLVTGHDMWRYPRPILRPARALSRGGWHAQRDQCRGSYQCSFSHHIRRYRTSINNNRPEAAKENEECRRPG